MQNMTKGRLLNKATNNQNSYDNYNYYTYVLTNDSDTILQISQVLATLVKPNKTFTENKSYHNEISGEEAVKRLKVFGDLCYLTRHSEYWKCYVLSVCWNDKTLGNEKLRHFKMNFSDKGIRLIDGNHEWFESLEKLLNHYEKNRLDPAFPTIGKCITEDDYKAKVKEIQAKEIREQSYRCTVM